MSHSRLIRRWKAFHKNLNYHRGQITGVWQVIYDYEFYKIKHIQYCILFSYIIFKYIFYFRIKRFPVRHSVPIAKDSSGASTVKVRTKNHNRLLLQSWAFATFSSICYLLFRYFNASFCYRYSSTFLNFSIR
jgi:hypothetical protein